jgi:hypothetical protein
MDLNDISVHFTVILPPDIKLLVRLDVVKFFSCVFVHNQDQVSEDEQNHVQLLLLVN